MSPERLLLTATFLALASALVSLVFLLRWRARSQRWEAMLRILDGAESPADSARRGLALLGATLGVEALYVFQPSRDRVLASWDSLGQDREADARARLGDGEALAADLTAVWLGRSPRALAAFRDQARLLVPLLSALAAPASEEPREGFVELARVAAGVAHELNSPLAAILTDASRLKKSASDEGSARRAETIVQAVERCRSVVDKLLLYARRPYDLARATSFSQLVRLPVDLNALVEDTARSLEADGQTVATELGPLRRRFAGDSRLLGDRLRHLLKGQGAICLATREETDRLILEVRETGELARVELAGLDEAAREHGGALDREEGRLVLSLPASQA